MGILDGPDWRSQYGNDIAYLEEKARKGELTSDNNILQRLDGKADNLPDLRRRLSEIKNKAK